MGLHLFLKCFSFLLLIFFSTSANHVNKVLKKRASIFWSSDSNQNNQFSAVNYDAKLIGPPSCQLPNPCLDPSSLPTNVSRSLLKTSRLFYPTMGSCWGYSLAAEVLLARKVRSNEELNEMCPTLFSKSSGQSFYSGYGKTYANTCFANPITRQRDCIPLLNASDPDVDMTPMNVNWNVLEEFIYTFSKKGLLSPTLIATDDKTYLLFYHCVNKRFGDFLLLTTLPFISDKRIIPLVLEKAHLLGFQDKDILFRPCQSPNYPSSFRGANECL